MSELGSHCWHGWTALSLILFITFINRISRRGHGVSRVWFGDLRTKSLLLQMMWSWWLHQSVTSSFCWDWVTEIGHELLVVIRKRRWQVQAAEINFLPRAAGLSLRVGKKLGHPGGARSRAAAPPLAQAPKQDGSWALRSDRRAPRRPSKCFRFWCSVSLHGDLVVQWSAQSTLYEKIPALQMLSSS